MEQEVKATQGDFFSYGTCIRTTLKDPQDPSKTYQVGNTTRYSITGAAHQNTVNVRECDIVLDDVPRGATARDLRVRALAVLLGV